MPMNEGSKEAAILVFAMPKKPAKGVTPPTEAEYKKSDKSALPDMEDEATDKPEMCDHCEGEGCEECDYKGYKESDGYEAGAEDSHKQHMKVIAKLVDMFDKD
jgi:hypothetical protein